MSKNWTLKKQILADLVKNRESGSLQIIKEKFEGIEGILSLLHTDPIKGIQESSLKERRIVYGENKLPEVPSPSFFSFWWDALQDKTLIILSIAAVISIVLGEAFPVDGDRATGWFEGAAILMAVFIVSLVTAINDWTKDKKFRKLTTITEDRKIKVIREGILKSISVHSIVVGDLVKLETGDFIPADMLYIEGQNLSVDESSMTGESENSYKDEDNPFLLANCMVMEGVALGVVIAVGINSQWGQIKQMIQKQETKTPLQEKLEDLAEFIGKLGMLAAFLTFLALILVWAINDYGIDKKEFHWIDLSRLVDFLITGITIVVVAVPEGLPLAVTISLAYSMIQMMKDQNLVRHLSACETMGGATNICSDKTGTLTQNRMTVRKLWMEGIRMEKMSNLKEISNKAITHLLCESISINSSASLEERSGRIEYIGGRTECALLMLVRDLGLNYETFRKVLKKSIVHIFPFTSKKKRMSTLIRLDQPSLKVNQEEPSGTKGKKEEVPDEEEYREMKKFRLHCKGASEMILERCEYLLDENAKTLPLEETKKEELKKIIEEWASHGFRTLAIAYRELETNLEIKKEREAIDLDKNLTLLCIVGIEDPIREEVPSAVRECQKAGIVVRMVTGDNLLTAKNIASQCNILTKDGIAMEGPEFRQLTVEKFDSVLPRLQVIARCSPEDKLILVTRLRNIGEVVAVTGDGTNDALILKQADVGFAMGIQGTEVAKDASDIILLDDNFSSIEKAMIWGRNVYDSIRKFIQFQLTVNIVAVAVAFIGAVTTGKSPLTAVQLLWVNLIMDTMGALALATAPPNKEELLKRKPYGRFSPLITPRMWKFITGMALYQLFVMFFTLYGIQELPLVCRSDNPVHDCVANPLVRTTLVFNGFVFCQIFNEINCRKVNKELNVFSSFFDNYIFLFILAITIVIQAILVEFGGRFVQTVPLTWNQWLYCIILGLISLPVAFFIRLLPFFNKEEAEYLKERPHEKQPLLRMSDSRGMEEGRGIRLVTSPALARGSGSKIRLVRSLSKRVERGTRY